MSDSHGQLAREVASYALDALDSPERERVEPHVQCCNECGRLLDNYRAVIALLPYALVVEAPSPGARASLMARVRERNFATATVWSLWGRLLHRTGSIRWLAVGGLIMGLLVWNLQLQRGEEYTVEIADLARLPAEHITALEGLDSSAGASGRLYLTRGGQQPGLAVAGLPALPAGRAYQLWFVRPDESVASGGVFRVNAHGEALVKGDPPGSLRQFVTVKVTEEPQGGSPAPTGRSLLAGTL